MRYELYEGPVSEFDDLYIDVIYYSTDDADEMVTAINEYMSTYYDDNTYADQVLTVRDKTTGKFYKPSDFVWVTLEI